MESVGENAFLDCSNLTDIYYGGTREEWIALTTGDSFGSNNTVLTNATIHYPIGMGASGKCGNNVTWLLDNEGILTISGTGAMTDYASASAVPWAGEDIYAVAVEEGLTHVGSYAFSGLFLDNVLLPETLESIGDNAFYGASVAEAHFAGNQKQWEKDMVIGDGNNALTDVVACDKDVTYQGEGFSLANGVVTSTVSSLPVDFRREYNDYVFEVVFVDVTEIGMCACGERYFMGEVAGGFSLTRIKSVTIPDSVTRIQDYAFQGCTNLTSIAIPDSVISIGADAFKNCDSLSSVNISSLEKWCNIQFAPGDSLSNPRTSCSNPLYYAHKLYLNSELIQDLVIPDSLTIIRDDAFSGCTSLKSVTIPESITSIGDYAFEYCSSLTSISISDSVTRIGAYAFRGCSSLMSITIPDSVISIGMDAFSGCRSLTSVTIPDSVTSIGKAGFIDCGNLTSITIPDSVTSIGEYTLYGCNSLTSVTIPDSVTSIGAYAFYGCSSLTNVYYSGTAAMWDEITIGGDNEDLINATRHYALAAGETGDCRWNLSESGALQISGDGRMADYTENAAPWYAYREQIATIDIKDKVEYLGSYAFSGLEKAAAVSGMNGVTSIGEGAFKDCAALPAFTLPAAVTNIGQNAFSGCTLLTSAGPADSGAAIEFGWNRVIPTNAFNGADCLETLTIPEGVTRVMLSAAANCTALSSVSLPTTLTNIQQNAFSGCASLQEIALPDALKTLGVSAFQNTGLTSVTIPISVTTIGNHSFDGSLLADVYYPGSKNQWNAITVGSDNTVLSGAELHLGRFDINIDSEITNGNVSVTVNGEAAATALENDTVYLTVTPAAGYELESLTVMQGETDVPVTNNTFTMPAGDVTVSATFTRSMLASGTCGPNLTYTLYGDWELVIEGTGAMDNWYSPFEVPWYGADGATSANPYLTRIKKVTLCPGVTSIGSFALETGRSLTDVVIANTVTSIGESAFEKCSSLESITIPSSVSTLGPHTFSNCGNLKNVDMGSGITSIGYCAFSYCGSLTGISLPENLTTIGSEVFKGCHLTSVFIPKRATDINSYAFDSCTTLASISVDTDNSTYSAVDGVFFSKDLSVLIRCPEGKTGEVSIPVGTLSIDRHAFQSCKVTSVIIPEGVTNIENSAFNCCNVESVVIPVSVKKIEDSAFRLCNNLTDVYYDGAKTQWNAIRIGSENSALTSAECHFGRFDINIDSEITNGSVSVTVNGEAVAIARENDSVSLNVNPANGYELDTLTVRQGETAVTVTDNTFAMPAGDVTVTAVFTPIRHSVSFDNEFGTAPEEQIVNEGGKAAAPADPTEDGYRFSGWYAVKDGFNYDWVSEEGWSLIFEDGEYTYPIMSLLNTWKLTDENDTAHSGDEYLRLWDFDTDTVTADVCLFARWKPVYDVTVSDDLENGTVQADKDLAAESETVTLTVTPATGYELESLSVMQGETPVTVENNQFTMPAGGVTVTATFKKLTYTITWQNEDGSVIDTTTVEYGETPTHADAAKAATAEYTYTFNGWTPELTVVTGDAAYKATFTAIPVFSAPTFILPRNINTIEESAFEGLPMTIVEIPNGCESIKKWAFRNCTSLTQIRIPASVTFIDATAFDGCENVFVYGAARSTAETYAREHGFTFIAES